MGQTTGVAIHVPECVRVNHRELSPLAEQFLDFAIAHPDWLQPIDVPSSWANGWPTFVGPTKLAELRTAALAVSALVRSIPDRFFGEDRDRLSRYFGLAPTPAAPFLTPPTGIGCAFARGDFIEGEGGFKCLELNLSARLGGWEPRFWEAAFRGKLAASGFLTETTAEITLRDTVSAMLSHVVVDVRQALDDGRDELNVVLVNMLDLGMPNELLQEGLNELLAPILHDMGLSGTLVVTGAPGHLRERDGELYCGKLRVHAAIDMTRPDVGLPDCAVRAMKARGARLYNTRESLMLCDKRALAILSENETTAALSTRERELVQRHVPWTRIMCPGPTTYRGTSIRIPDDIERLRERLVLKPTRGLQGQGVVIGEFCDQDEWRKQVEAALATPSVVQEYVQSKPYFYQQGDGGCGEHGIMWGMFCFGPHYGGAIATVSPLRSKHGVIHGSLGSQLSPVFEHG